MKNDAWLNKKFIERAKELNRIGLFNLYPTESWALLPTINECNSILDIGCADGNKLPICRKINKKINYTGFDLNPELIKIAKKKYKKDLKSNFYVNDINEIHNNLKFKKFDLIMSWAVFYSINNYKDLIKKLFITHTKKFLIFDLRFSQIRNDIIDLKKSYTFYENENNKSPYIISSYRKFIKFLRVDLKGHIKNAYISGYCFNPSKNVWIRKDIKKPFICSIVLERGKNIRKFNFTEKIPNV